MINSFKKMLCLVFALILIILYCITNVNAQSNINIEKVHCNATLTDNFSENEILIVLNKEISRKLEIDIAFNDIDYLQVEDLTSSYDSEEKMNDNFRKIYKMSLKNSSKDNVLNTIKKLEKLDFIYSAEPNYYDQINSVPNDYSSTKQYAIEFMDLDKAWNFTTGSEEVTVGIIDTGIDGDHLDLKDNINTELSKSFSSDFTNALEDIEGHGTHVAGIIGAVGNNNIGTIGVNWKVSLVSLRVADSSGNLPIANVISAIDYANEKDVDIDILNYSGDGSNYNNLIESRKQAIENYNGLFVCAAGNNARNTDINSNYPSSHLLSNLISVGALDSDGNRSAKSNYGVNTVQIYAPGGNIYSTINGNLYDYYSGTSMASPQVAGVAALLLSIKPDLSASQLKYAILNSAETISISLPNRKSQSVKKINAFNAVKYILSGHSTFLSIKYNDKNINKTIDSTNSFFLNKNAMIKLGIQNEDNFKFVISSNHPINTTLYDYNLNVISSNQSYSVKDCTLEFSKYLSVGSYYLKINFSNDNILGTINVAIYGPPHAHTYDNWLYYSRSAHIEACDCGETGSITKTHVIRHSDITNNRARCLECEYLLDLTTDIAITYTNKKNMRYSINGSYILPSGIMVLMDADIDSFFEGKLIFYSSDEIPQLESS